MSKQKGILWPMAIGSKTIGSKTIELNNIRFKTIGLITILVIALVLAISPFSFAEMNYSLDNDQTVSSVKIQLIFPDGKDINSMIKNRIVGSLEKVAENVIEGQKLFVINQTRDEILLILQTVFDRIFLGYELADIGMVVDEQTVIFLTLEPANTLIEKVNVDLQIKDVSDTITQVVDQEILVIQEKLAETLLWLPVESFNWAQNIVEPLLYNFIVLELPGFEPNLDFTIGSEVNVNLTLKPQGRLVDKINVNLETHSIPRVLIFVLEERIERELELFKGLPIELLEKHQTRLIQAIEDAIYRDGRSKFVYLNGKPEIDFGSTTNLTLAVDWIDYKVEFIGELNLGANSPEHVLSLSLGKQLGPNLLFQLEDRLTISSFSNSLSLGLEYSLGAGFTTITNYRLFENELNAAIDWRQGSFGFTFAQTYSSNLHQSRLSLNYYPGFYNQISLVGENDRIWLSFQQTL